MTQSINLTNNKSITFRFGCSYSTKYSSLQQIKCVTFTHNLNKYTYMYIYLNIEFMKQKP